MTRLYVVCEGLTGVNFVTELPKPHLETSDPLRLTVGAPNLTGHYTYAQLKKSVKNLLGPSASDASTEAPVERVHHLEHQCTEDVGDREHKMILLLEYLCRIQLTHCSPALRAGRT